MLSANQSRAANARRSSISSRVIVSAPASALASEIAVRIEYIPSESAQTPSPAAASCVSTVVFTTNVAALIDCAAAKLQRRRTRGIESRKDSFSGSGVMLRPQVPADAVEEFSRPAFSFVRRPDHQCTDHLRRCLTTPDPTVPLPPPCLVTIGEIGGGGKFFRHKG